MMDKYSSVAAEADEWRPYDAASIAESVEKDFSGLLAILGSHLRDDPDSNAEAKLAITKAKGAAERGLILSRQLVRQLRDNPQ